jgi:pimeloyl-ACP methyl ester carboxylesterase
MFADDVAALMQAIGIQKAHVSGLSLGAATGIWLAAKYPDRVKSLSLHSGWPKSDAYLKTVVQSWQVMAKAMNSVPEIVIQGIFPWCFTPELYRNRITSRPFRTSCAAAPNSQSTRSSGVRCSDDHDAEAQLGKIRARHKSPSGATTWLPPRLPTG